MVHGALSVSAPTHTPSNATDAPTYAALSLVEDRGTTALTALSLSGATAAPMERSTAVANVPPPPPPTMTPPTTTPLMPRATAKRTTLFVKLNLI